MIGSPEKAFARATISAAGFWAFLEFVYWRIQNFMGGSFSVMGGLAPPRPIPPGNRYILHLRNYHDSWNQLHNTAQSGESRNCRNGGVLGQFNMAVLVARLVSAYAMRG